MLLTGVIRGTFARSFRSVDRRGLDKGSGSCIAEHEDLSKPDQEPKGSKARWTMRAGEAGGGQQVARLVVQKRLCCTVSLTLLNTAAVWRSYLYPGRS